MAGVNKVILVGNLGEDPEARSLNNGGEVVNLRVATSETGRTKRRRASGRTEWHRVVIFNENLGRVAKNYLTQGHEGLSRRADPDPQMDRPVGPTTATRPKSCCNGSGANWSSSIAARAAAVASAARYGETSAAQRFRRRRRVAPHQSASGAGGVRHRPGRRRPLLGVVPSACEHCKRARFLLARHAGFLEHRLGARAPG